MRTVEEENVKETQAALLPARWEPARVALRRVLVQNKECFLIK